MLPEAVRKYLEAHREEHVEQLLELIRFPSVSSQREHDGDALACAEHIAAALRALGFAAELRPWRRHPVLIARRPADRPPAATVLVYAHYDVQPPEPLGLWDSPPFQPVIRDGAVYGRGASDDKGQLWAQLKAVEALIAAGGGLPVNLTFFFEGEEEVGSPELERFVTDNAADLSADFAVISDSSFFAAGLPSITYGLRGLAYVELTLKGPAGDLHSGTHGGAVVNPLNALAKMLAALHDSQGRVTLEGFYDDVLPLTAAEAKAWEALPFDPARYAEEIGCQPVGGEKGLGLLHRRWARPTLDCNGIVGGYQGEGAKTVIPATAAAKVSMRLVADQRPEKVVASFRRFVEAHTPEGLTAEVAVWSEARPVLVDPTGPTAGAVAAALREAFGAAPALVRNGASVPVTELIQRVLKVDPILMGFGLPDDNLHAPNEHFHLSQFHGGIVAAAAMLNNLSRVEAG